MKVLPTVKTPADLRNIKRELLPQLCEEIREEIIKTTSKNGGHLGSSLGAVEMITALHYVFNTPKDKLVFDTGHQVQLVVDRALLADVYISGHPGISTSTLRLGREDLLRYAASTGHDPIYINLPDPREEEN